MTTPVTHNYRPKLATYVVTAWQATIDTMVNIGGYIYPVLATQWVVTDYTGATQIYTDVAFTSQYVQIAGT